ncbi:mannonate dehydratase [Treponema zioleckii]|uniref:mannonate dehydratase n=1 Tax=Treponema zioleckii TaxID=331680 RepID=UPI00168BDE4F|nr:mannonate dehydratase [Treponema zioleckii]
MEMTLRWYGSKFDTVTLEQIRQIPGVKGIITTLYDTKPGEVWSRERIRALKDEVAKAGLRIAGIESVNVSDAIKTGSADRDKDIDAYIETLKNLGEEDIHLVCYNFMPVFDWTRTELARKREDGSTVLAYTQEAVDAIKPEEMFNSISGDMNGTVMPGWEPERMAKVKELFELYKDIDDEKLFENLKYFLERIMPVCDKYNINMAIHPDDPAWSVFGLPRIITNQKNITRMMKMVDNPHNGVTFCSGSYGTNPENNLPEMIRSLKGRIHFAHVRNLRFNTFQRPDGSAVTSWTGEKIKQGKPNFEEAAHLSSDGNFDMYEIMKALYDIGFTGPIRPDHGRMIWGEKAMPGYGLYDRALGAAYLNGLWEAIEKNQTRK